MSDKKYGVDLTMKFFIRFLQLRDELSRGKVSLIFGFKNVNGSPGILWRLVESTVKTEVKEVERETE